LSSLGQFTIHTSASSALRALGVTSPGTPGWDRPAQLLLGAAVAFVAVRRGRWAAVPLAVLAARLLLDPATYPYYTAGLLVACAAVDLLTPDRRLPLWTAAAAGFYAVEQLGTVALSPGTLGTVRACYCLAVLALLVVPGGQARAVRARPQLPPSPSRVRAPLPVSTCAGTLPGPVEQSPGTQLPGRRRRNCSDHRRVENRSRSAPSRSARRGTSKVRSRMAASWSETAAQVRSSSR